MCWKDDLGGKLQQPVVEKHHQETPEYASGIDECAKKKSSQANQSNSLPNHFVYQTRSFSPLVTEYPQISFLFKVIEWM